MFDVWNTNGDTAYLYDSQGNLVSQRYQGAIPTPTPTPAPTLNPEKNLVAYYSFDDGTARDDSGNSHDGSIIGATEITGVRGKALFFDGKNDYIKLPLIFSADPGQVTVMAFIKTKSESPTRQYSFYNGNYEFGLADSNFGLNGVCVKLNQEKYTNIWHCAGGTITADGITWTHEVGVIDTINHRIQYYQNGALIDSQILPDDSFARPYSTNCVSIGAYTSEGSLGKKDFFAGGIDEVRIYNRVLSDEEIHAIYKSYIPNPTPTPTKKPTTPTTTTPIPTTKVPTITAQPTSSGLKAAFSASPQTGSFPLEVRFSDQSTGNPHTWTWNFGDGSYSNEEAPVHLYGDVGTYTVNLKVTGNGGSSSSEKPEYIVVTDPSSPPPIVPTTVPTTPITAIPTIVPTPTAIAHPTIIPTPTTGKLVADFSSNVRSGNPPLQVSFYDKSSGQPDKWFWSFGDGSYSEEQNPVHSYADQMTYLVSLEVKKQGLVSLIAKENWITII